jgi:exodeoxyribonuclease VII large subunit
VGQQRRLVHLGITLARRFRRLHRRRREQLLHKRYQLQLAAERMLHRAEVLLLEKANQQKDALANKQNGIPI